MRKLLTDTLHGAVEYLMLSLILAAMVPGLLPEACPPSAAYLYLAAQPAYCLPGPLLWTVFRGKARAVQLILGLLCCAGGICLTFRWIPFDLRLLLFTIALSTGLFVRGFFIAAKPWDEIAPSQLYTVTILVNLLFMVAVAVIPSLAPYRTAVTVAGPIVALVSLLTMNGVNMQSVIAVQRDARRAGHMAVSKTMKTANRVMVLVTFGAVLVFSLFGSAAGWILRLFAKLTRWLVGEPSASAEPVTEDASEAAEDVLMESVRRQAAGRTPLSPALQKVFHVLMTVAAAAVLVALFALLVYALYLLARKLIALYRRMVVSGTQSEPGVEEYTDIAEHLALKDTLRDAAEKLKSRARSLKREPGWESMATPAEKVRYLYRFVIQKGMRSGWEYSSARTARQNVRSLSGSRLQSSEAMEDLGELYDAVRYGEKEPDPGKLEELHQRIS